MNITTDERARIRRQRSEQAIQLALQNRWEDAANANRQLLQLFPNDTEAWNRLGKALGELGRYDEAREAYARTLELDKLNQIARKNLKRLEGLGPGTATPVAQTVDPSLFIEATGKSGQSPLVGADPEVLRLMAPGEKVVLAPNSGTLAVATASGESLGQVEPRIGLRLLRLIEGGNQYEAVITSLEGGGRLLIRETYQHPAQIGRLSFPPPGPEGFRAHTRDSLLRYGNDEDDDRGEEPSDEWTDTHDDAGLDERAPRETFFESESDGGDDEGDEE